MTASLSGPGLARARSSLNLPASVERSLQRAWTIRMLHHAPDLMVVRPHRTLPISVTGEQCALQCRHCQAHYLKAMVPVQQALLTYDRGAHSSCLISGGCDASGAVPIGEHRGVLQQLKDRGARLNCHVGVCDPASAEQLQGLVDRVSFDLVGDDVTLREVYGVRYDVEALWDSFRSLSRSFPTYPHICLGLRAGRLHGEYAVLERLTQLNPPALVVLVLMPTPGTPYAHCQPPAVSDVAQFLSQARLLLPTVPLYIGCMRPGGNYRALIDQVGVWAGAQKLVKPSPVAVGLARDAGLTVQQQEECCVL